MEGCQLEFQSCHDEFPISKVLEGINECGIQNVHESNVALSHFVLSQIRQGSEMKNNNYAFLVCQSGISPNNNKHQVNIRMYGNKPETSSKFFDETRFDLLKPCINNGHSNC